MDLFGSSAIVATLPYLTLTFEPLTKCGWKFTLSPQHCLFTKLSEYPQIANINALKGKTTLSALFTKSLYPAERSSLK